MTKKQLRVITHGGGAVFRDLNAKNTYKAIHKYLKVLQANNERALLIFEKVHHG